MHGGGFYVVRKFKVAPEALPEPLHWFKWEAYWTWMSGFALFIVMYYMHAGVYMIDRGVADITALQAVSASRRVAGCGLDFLRPALQAAGIRSRAMDRGGHAGDADGGRRGACRTLFSGRAVYIQVGAMLGTIMAANVLLVIIPSQRKLVEAKERGVAPDPVYGRRGKQRSVHNNYFTLPVLFIMISNHYPMTYRPALTAGWCCSRSCCWPRTSATSSTCVIAAGRCGRFP